MQINEITIERLQQVYRKKDATVKEVVQEYISRIHRYDEGADGMNSVIEINPDAIGIAEELDGYKEGRDRLLYGIPVLIKDNIATGDRMHTSGGSVALANSYTRQDAELVKTLRKKGAVILGKTNMTEFANYMTQGMPNGYSSRGGQVKNAYNKEQDPSGSSSGSAVSVSANLCVASIGSDTCNSIVAPGLVNGIVGLRPSSGVISQTGIIPISFTLDTAGPFTRTVEDAAVMFAGLTNTLPVKCDITNIKGKVIGFNEWLPEDMSEDTIVGTEEAVKELEKAGAVIKRITIPKTKHIMDVMKYEFKYAMNQYLGSLPKEYPVRTLKDIIEYNNMHAEMALKYGQTFLLDAEENTTGYCDEEVYQEILRDRRKCMAEIREQLKGMEACIMLSYNNILQYTGLPVITIPCGLNGEGMPFGIYMTSLTDEVLIRCAYALEVAVGKRVEPMGV